MTDPAKPATLADVERLETMRAGDDELMYRFQLSIDAPALFAAVRELERDRQDEEAIYELCWEICNEVRSSSLHIAGSTTTLDPEHVRFEHQANGADECAYKILAAKNAAVRVPLNDTGADDQGSSCEPVHAAPQGQLNESSGRQEQQCAKGMAPVAEPAAPAGPAYRCTQCGEWFSVPQLAGCHTVARTGADGQPYPDPCGPVITVSGGYGSTAVAADRVRAVTLAACEEAILDVKRFHHMVDVLEGIDLALAAVRSVKDRTCRKEKKND